MNFLGSKSTQIQIIIIFHVSWHSKNQIPSFGDMESDVDGPDFENDIERSLHNYRSERISEAEIDSNILAEIEKFKPGNVEEIPDRSDSNELI